MDCTSIKNEGLAERYLHNRLKEGDTDSYETHLLECPRCRRELELLQAAQADLAARAHEIRTWTPAKPFFLRWQAMGVTALVVVFIAAGAFFFRPKKAEQVLTAQDIHQALGSKEKPEQAKVLRDVSPHINAIPVPSSPNTPRDKTVRKNGVSLDEKHTSDGSMVSGARTDDSKLTAYPSAGEISTAKGEASIEVATAKPSGSGPSKAIPNKETPTLTAAQGVELYYLGSTSAPAFTFSGFTSKEQAAEGGDVSSHSQPSRAIPLSRTAFRDAMNIYIDGNYSEAAERLEQAAVKEPGALDVQFYLGICRLLIGQPQRAIEPLKNASKAYSPTVQQQAHYYLAKAYVQSLQLREAEDEFRIASQMTGPLKNDAGNMLGRVQALRGQLGKD